MVEILLRQEEVSPERQDYSGQTLLSFAALYGHEVVGANLFNTSDSQTFPPEYH